MPEFLARLALVAGSAENLDILVHVFATKGNRGDVIDVSGGGKNNNGA